MTARVERTAERRRRRRDVRRRILDATLELLEERRWPDIPLEDVMAAAGLSRTAFYRHFDDRDQLLLALLAEVGANLERAGQGWKQGEGEPIRVLHEGLAELTAAMVDHGRLVQAIVDASTYDPDVRSTYNALVERQVSVTAERIRAEIAAERSQLRDPDEIASALVRMSESYLLAALGRRPLADTERITDTLTQIWGATIYGRPAWPD